MAPSVEINSRKNANITLKTKDQLLINTSELNVKNEKECDRLTNGSIKEDAEEKIRTYRADKTFTSRKEEAAAIRSKFPTKIPIIVDRFHKESNLPRLERSKFLVPQEITMSQFVTIIRNRMKLSSNQAFYLLVNNRSMLSLSKTLAEVYADHKEKDGFLYMTYASQEVFGVCEKKLIKKSGGAELFSHQPYDEEKSFECYSDFGGFPLFVVLTKNIYSKINNQRLFYFQENLLPNYYFET